MMMCEFNRCGVVCFIAIIVWALSCEGQESSYIPKTTFRQFLRTMMIAPKGRSATFGDVLMKFYGTNSTSEPRSYRLKAAHRLIDDPNFDLSKPTVVYAHGYVELITDKSAQAIVRAYLQRGGYNVVMLDWSNKAFGNYIGVAADVPAIGKDTGAALAHLIKRGLPVATLHLVGHSLGVHLMAYAARTLAKIGHKVPRLTGLDPAYPGFYPPIFGQPVSAADAAFVDVIHTDAGGYGAPTRGGHADWWPNGGKRKQPDCPTSVLLTDEDFCSHWRSWAFWAESVVSDAFLSRRCASHDAFLRGVCRDSAPVYMGLRATPDLRGDFYLRTAGSEPYNLGVAGAD